MHHCKSPCQRCGVQFSETKLKQHTGMKKMCNPKGMRCKFCNELIAGISGLKEHIDETHKEEETAPILLSKEENLRCLGCDRSFRSNRYLIFHQYSKKDCPQYNGNKEENHGPITCTICSKVFRSLWNLALHQTKKDSCSSKVRVENVTEEILAVPVPCWGCQEEFRSLEDLANHQQKQHDCPAFSPQPYHYGSLYQSL